MDPRSTDTGPLRGPGPWTVLDYPLFNFVSMPLKNGSFLCDEEVTIFEGHRRRDSDSCTHP